MLHDAIAALRERLRPHLNMSKDRAETLALIVIAMVSARTVNLSHLAAERPGAAKVASTYRRFQRFFQHVRLGLDWSAPLIARMSGLDAGGSWALALDRTQWRVGETEVNYLVLAVVTRRARLPLMWTVVPGRGCSDTAQRIELMRRYLALFDASTIRLLTADREFIGQEWLDFLDEAGVPFAIRLREDLRVTDGDGHDLTLAARLRGRGRGRGFEGWIGPRGAHGRRKLFFVAKILKGEWLILATNVAPRAALDGYKKRWAIECLVSDAKTRGLNLEDTRLTAPEKLDLMMGLVALAIAWVSRAARDALGHRWPPRKTHGYLAKSWFRTGFDQIRRALRTNPINAIEPWRKIAVSPTKSNRVV